MCYYIGSELKNALRRRYVLCYVAGMIILCVLANLSMICFRTIYGMNDGAFGYNLIIFAEGVFAIPYYSSIFIADIVFGKDYPDPRIRDKATIGLSRTKLYLGKFAAALILSGLLLVIAVVGFIGITVLFQLNDGTIDALTILDFIEKVVVAIPLWVAGVAMGNMFLFLYRRKRKAFIAFFIVVLAIPRLIMFFAAEPFKLPPFTWITNILITPEFNALQFFFTMNYKKILLLGTIYTVAACAIGITGYRKKEF
ncbi:hypothetical protein D7X88_13585 [bacterium C-53]|nr:hypothetical protein [Lachnospiraceae bacterium]NBI04047.1 hypothetical protein [Lachnospiraceae bacterium]RKJ08823.1 hypothetical protein D7X88_13585 [bacterium C-53]